MNRSESTANDYLAQAAAERAKWEKLLGPVRVTQRKPRSLLARLFGLK